jgi:hypothetical protein
MSPVLTGTKPAKKRGRQIGKSRPKMTLGLVLHGIVMQLLLKDFSQIYDVVQKHHERNRAPRAPDPEQLRNVASRHAATTDVDIFKDDEESSDTDSDTDSDASSDNDKPRAKRHSQKPYTGKTTNPRKLGFYPPQWRDILEAAQKKWRPWMGYVCGFPDREDKMHLDEALRCITSSLSEHTEDGGKVEKGMDEEFLVLRLLTMW